MNVYLASPLGFAESTKPFMLELENLLSNIGITLVNPWRNPLGTEFEKAYMITEQHDRMEALRLLNKQIGISNEEALRRCDLVIAVLDGIDVDSGTASEIGFAYALQKRILGLRTDFRMIGDNEASDINLQLQYWIEASGCIITKSTSELVKIVKEFLTN